MASTKKRGLPLEYGQEAKKAKIEDITESSESKLTQRVVLNPADCNLDFNIVGNGLQGSALHEQGFAYCWSGARGNVGITRGKYCFGCKIIAMQPVDIVDTAPEELHVCRVGISRGDDNVGNLGETKNSFGFGGTGKISSAGEFLDYGEKFGIGDTIVCAVDLENKPLALIGFSKNGKWLGTAKQFDAGPRGLGVLDSPTRKLQWESALFPHVLLKNVVVQLQFSVEEGLVPEKDYKPWASALEDGNAMMGPTSSKPDDCEVMMMVGLPASGKTTWAEKWIKEHPEKRYVLLGTNLILDQMKVPGLMRKHNYSERFDRLMDKATGIFNTLLSRAAKTPRNYIIDQTNVYKNARKRKLKPFAFFQKVAVVVFPRPEELKFRADKRFKEMGKEVPADAVKEMLVNYVLPSSKDMPGSDEYFDQVIFVELNPAESQRHLDQMKHTFASATNLNSNNSLSYYRKSSVKEVTGFSPQDQVALAVSGGHWHNSPFHASNSQGPNHVNTAYQQGGPHASRESSLQAYQGNQYPAVVRVAAAPGNWSYESSLPRDDAGCSGSYGGIPSCGTAPYPFRNSMIEPFPVGSASTMPLSYSTLGGHFNDNRGRGASLQATRTLGYGMGGPYSRSNIEANNNIPGAAAYPDGSSMIEPSPVGSASTMPYSYSGHGGNYNDIGGPGADLQAPRSPTFVPRPLPSALGSAYGTPSPRPPYGNIPNELQYSGGYARPHPRYY
ncbi:hypothetical protein I3843_09G153100 [Carya illinoinensis]|nr:hypothetical protein I3843_09G153100 [Carya illinoinensis]